MAVRYWDYWNNTSSTVGTGTPSTHAYYRTWETRTTSTATSTLWSPYYTSNSCMAPTIERFLVSGFDDWSDQARATLTRLINDETNTGCKITMWIKGDVDVTDMGIQIRDLDWLMLKLRQIASSEDYRKIAECVATAQEEAAQVGTHPQGRDAKQARGESLSDAVPEGNAP